MVREEEFRKYNLLTLREIARQNGVQSPTSKRKFQLIKEIVDIMKDGGYVNVHLFINKNGIDYDFKYNASTLKNYWNYSYLPTYEMQAPDRKEFEKLYGSREDLHYEDIYRIEYRHKPIYEDKNFVKECAEESQELGIN